MSLASELIVMSQSRFPCRRLPYIPVCCAIRAPHENDIVRNRNIALLTLFRSNLFSDQISFGDTSVSNALPVGLKVQLGHIACLVNVTLSVKSTLSS